MSDWARMEFKRKAVRAISLLLIFFLFFSVMLLFGCGNQKRNGQGMAMSPEDMEAVPFYWVKNPLEVNLVQEDAYQEGITDGFYTKIEISGLKDKTVEKAVNAKIEALFQEMKESREIPPYRGILAMRTESDFGDTIYVDMFVYGCFNNILSIYAYRSGSLNGVYFTDIQPLNLDLNTGEEITLADVFRDGADYQTLFGERVYRTLVRENATEETEDYYFNEGAKLAAPFQGVLEDQKFLLGEGCISLIFDYENPEFFLQYNSPYMVEIGYNEFPGEIALETRFYDEETDLYESEEPDVKVLVPHVDEVRAIESVPMPEASENTYLSVTYRYGEDTPEELQQEAAELAVQVDQELLDEILLQGRRDPNYFYEYSKDVAIDRVGNFYNLMNSTSYYQKEEWGAKIECLVYDQYLRPVAISDLFYEGIDYKPMIQEKLEQSYRETYSAVDPDTGEPVETPLEDYTIEELLEGMTFSVQQDGVFFYTEPIRVSMAGIESDYASPLYGNLTFEEIGCEKMAIFDRK